MAWFLNPALTRFRNEVDSRWPRRDLGSDGTIGDRAHQLTDSDHNPDRDGSVDAWDMDVDGLDVQKVIAAALKHESIEYVIYNRRITSRSMSGGLGVWHPYNGDSPHEEHVHFNTRPSHENSAKPWFTDQPEDDMYDQDAENVAWATTNRALAALRNDEFCEYTVNGKKRREVNGVHKKLKDLEGKLDAILKLLAPPAKSD